MSENTTKDVQFAIDILPRVSRTFALSIEALPEPLRSTIRVSYLLCRIVDTIEDDPDLPVERRQWLFDEFARVVGDDEADFGALEEAFHNWGDTDDQKLCQNVGASLRIFRGLDPALTNAARPHILEMAKGMAEYSLRWRGPKEITILRDTEDLERYCYFVAGTVGNLLTSVFIEVNDELSPDIVAGLRERAVSFGLGLQLTNIVKDIADDRERGWSFVPRSLCLAHDLRPEELLDPDKRDNAMEVVKDVVDLARGHLEKAIEYTLSLPPQAVSVRLFVLVPLALALSSLTLVERSPEVLGRDHKVKVSRETVAATLLAAQEVVGDNEGIRRLCDRSTKLEL